jgi:hypothetical protein
MQNANTIFGYRISDRTRGEHGSSGPISPHHEPTTTFQIIDNLSNNLNIDVLSYSNHVRLGNILYHVCRRVLQSMGLGES